MAAIDSKLLARQIDTYCASNAISKAEFTRNTGISSATLSQWRKGLYEASDKSIEAIENYVNMPIDALLYGHPSQSGIKKAAQKDGISEDGYHIGELYDRADEKDKLLTHSVLDKYDGEPDIISIGDMGRNPGGMLEFDVYDEAAAAGLGNYLTETPPSHREQFPSPLVPKGAEFCIRISGDSMEPYIHDGGTVFVHQCVSIDSGKVGIFVLNGASFCKQLVVDRDKNQVRLRSLNPKYEDIIITAADDLRTIGQVL